MLIPHYHILTIALPSSDKKVLRNWDSHHHYPLLLFITLICGLLVTVSHSHHHCCLRFLPLSLLCILLVLSLLLLSSSSQLSFINLFSLLSFEFLHSVLILTLSEQWVLLCSFGGIRRHREDDLLAQDHTTS